MSLREQHELEQHRDYLLAIANRELTPPLRRKVAASDLVQQSLLEACRDMGQFRGTRLGLRRWLRRILLHNLANVRRQFHGTAKRNINREHSLSKVGMALAAQACVTSPAESPSGILSRQETSKLVESKLQELPQDYQSVIALRNREGYSFEQIGRELNRTPDATRKLWSRAVERLSELLAEPPC